jgi:CII-binding regulator of phage lambda lysogenization HflD
MDSREIFPSMYKRNLRKEKYVENISNEVSDGMHRMGLEGTVRSLVLWKKLNGKLLLLKVVFLRRMIPITGPQF